MKKFINFMNESIDYDPSKVETFIRKMENIIQEMEDEFDEGAGDQLMEPDDANVAEQMDELDSDLSLGEEDYIEILKRLKDTKHLKHYDHLIEWYLTQKPKQESRLSLISDITELLHIKDLSNDKLLSIKRFIKEI